MAPQLQLTDKEKTLRRLLLDVSEYIHTEKHLQRPELRITGGWVRDKLIGADSKDIDIGIDSMTGEKFGLYMKEFMNEIQRSVEYGKDIVQKIAKIAANPEKSKHLETATTHVLGLDIDLVNLRKETYADDSRNPQMESATPEEDALRRDATVNALFYNLQTGEVEDLTGRGLQDMKDRIIRTPLEPYQTFKDDPLRVLRLIRFAGRLSYSIDPQALDCMKNKDIQEALRIKISRERVGIEIEKMLKGRWSLPIRDDLGSLCLGAHPLKALELIDKQNLYTTVFSDPNRADVLPSKLDNWSKAYHFLDFLLNDLLGRVLTEETEANISVIRRLVLQDPEDVYHAWVLAALSPWSTSQWPQDPQARPTKSKPSLPAATTAAREGLKVANKTMSVTKCAAEHCEEIIAVKDAFCESIDPAAVPAKRKQETCSRDQLGMAIRRWGYNWRTSVVYAMMLEAMHQEPQEIVARYASWLLELEKLQLLQAYELKPLVDGKQLMAALGRKGGPWLTKALDLVVEWQLRNPESQDSEKAIDDVREMLND